MKKSLTLATVLGIVFLSSCSNSQMSPTPVANESAAQQISRDASVLSSDGSSESAAAAYCEQTHGRVELRRPVYGVNGTQLLFLSGRRDFCQYTHKKDGSRIHILLTTLYTTRPTLAALAYILKPPPSGSCHGNPASCYCTYLGGSDQFGTASGAGGGWYKKNAIDQVLEACIFPDMSSIDSWGLAYHAQGIIRGIDLTKVMRYHYPGSSTVGHF